MAYGIYFRRKGTKRWFRDKGMKYHTRESAKKDLQYDKKFYKDCEFKIKML